MCDVAPIDNVGDTKLQALVWGLASAPKRQRLAELSSRPGPPPVPPTLLTTPPKPFCVETSRDGRLRQGSLWWPTEVGPTGIGQR